MDEDTIASELVIESAPEPSKPLVLELRGVTFRSRSESGLHLQDTDLRIREGELVTVQIDAATRTREVASMIQGLIAPSEGEVLFCDQDWLGGDYDRHFRMRSQIGRVFEGQAWIENLNVDENVTLSCRHHGWSEASIRESARFWVKRLEIEGLSRKRPAFVAPSTLQIHQWIRAFLGSPKLLLLERPLQFLSTAWLPKLIGAIDQLRSRGAAVLWFHSGTDLEAVSIAEPHVRLRLQDRYLRPATVNGGLDHE